MRNLTTKFVLLIAGALLACASTSSLNAQATTLGGFNNQNSKRQKSPQRQLAKRIAPQEDSDKKKQLQNKPAKKANDKETDNKATKKPPQPVSKERKAELMAFVKANHPELLPLLNQLQSKRQQQFQTALRALDKNVKNLQAVKKRSPKRYQLSLDLWGVSSRIQLLTAQLAVTKSDKEKASIRKKLRSLFQQQSQLQRSQIKFNYDAAKKKYDRFAEQLKNHDSQRDSDLARKMAAIDKKVPVKNKPEKTENVKTKKPATQPQPPKKTPAKQTPPNKPAAKQTPAKQTQPNKPAAQKTPPADKAKPTPKVAPAPKPAPPKAAAKPNQKNPKLQERP